MIDGLKPYPTMKNSGTAWIGAVPDHWGVMRVKGVSRLAYGDALATEARQPGGVAVLGSNGRVGFHATANTTAPCIVVGRKGSFGKVNYSTEPVFAIDTTFFVDRRYSSAELRWLFYILSWLTLDEVSRDSAIPGLDREDAYQKRVPVPPRPEQAAIARFLDHVDRRICRYIRAKQKLIKLLEEQKRAVIHRAVTRGLDPDVRLNPSGVEWLGDVPEHWEVLTLRRVITRAVDGPHHSPRYLDSGIPFLSARNIKADRWSLGDAKYISEADYAEFSKRVVPEVGDVLYTKGGTTGVARAVDLRFRFQVWVHVAVLKVKRHKVLPEYLALALNSPRCYEQAQLFTRGATNQDLGLGRMKGIVLALPGLSEQEELLRALEERTRGLNDAAEKARREIELLREYRTRLIADVVTGKLDVREAAARLPQEAEDLEPLDETETKGEADEADATDTDAEPEEVEA